MHVDNASGTTASRSTTLESRPSLEILRQHAEHLAQLSGLLHQLSSPAAEVSGPGAAEAVVARLIHRANHHPVQVLASSATAPHDGDSPLLRRLHQELLSRRGTLRLLFPTRLLGDEETMAHLRRLAERGAEVRLSQSRLPNVGIYDGTLALIPGGRDRGGEVSVVQDPEYTETLRTLHNALWNQAVELSAFPRAAVAWEEDDAMARTLRMLSRGYTDERAARELGLSVRTYRRYVAELMTRLTASSRFQAGVRAAQAGFIEPS